MLAKSPKFSYYSHRAMRFTIRKEEQNLRSLVVNNRIIEYNLKYNAKKNVNIHIKPDLSVNVSAPRWVLKRELEDIIAKKSNWIFENIERQKRIQREKKINVLENGHSIWFKGEKCRLYFRNSDNNFVYQYENQIIVYSKNSDDIAYTQKIFKTWLKSLAEREFEQALEKYRAKMLKKYNIPEFTMQIRSMKTRWGTCTPSKKKITLNLYLMYVPHEYMEYVALHELTHFLEIYHNQHFYGIMKEFMPDYKQRQDTLNKEYCNIAKEI